MGQPNAKIQATVPPAPLDHKAANFDHEFQKIVDHVQGSIPSDKPREVKPYKSKRHIGLALSFALWVFAPLMTSSWYLYCVAQPQFASHLGIAIRSENTSSPLEFLGGISEFSGQNSSDSDILYAFLRSVELVQKAHAAFDLSEVYLREKDPVFSLGRDQRIEALTRHWNKKIQIGYDAASGLIEIRVLAFDPSDAKQIATLILKESDRFINQLSESARTDATAHAKEELLIAQERLTAARQAVLLFQNRTQIVDPRADIQGRMGLIQSLQSKLIAAQIDLQLLEKNSRPNVTRRAQILAAIEVLEKLVLAERNQLGRPIETEQNAYADLLSEFEALAVEREFAETAYLAAEAGFQAAQSEAKRKTLYLATFIGPTDAETSEYPQRFLILSVLSTLLIGSWALAVMIYYALRDRR